MNLKSPLILAVILVAFILAHDTAIASSVHGAPIVPGADHVASMHAAHASATAHQHPRHTAGDPCDYAPAIVDAECVTTTTANSFRPDSDSYAVDHDVCTIILQRDPQLRWTALSDIHTISGSARRALLQVYLN